MPMLQQANALEWSSLCPVSIFDQECPARRYLAFAKADIEDGSGDRYCVNAVGNAKRALHLRVEGLTEAYGGKWLHKRLSTFPERLSFCNGCGIISPSILRRLNALRNEVEHDYYVPTDEQTADFIDIVDLFLEATSWLVFKFPEDLELASDDVAYWFRIKCKPYSGLINIDRVDRLERSTKTLKVSARDEENYNSWMTVVVEKARNCQADAT